MKIVSDEYKVIAESLDGDARYIEKITLDDGTVLTDKIEELKYSNMCNNSTNFSFGNTASAILEFQIDMPTVELQDKEIVVEQGLELADGTIEYIKLGKFKVDSAETEAFRTSYRCVDAMTYKMSTKYESQLTYPATDLDVLEEVCAQVGVSLVNSDLTSHTVSKKLENYTKREIIGIIAQLQGKNAIINADGNLELLWYENADYVIGDSRIYSDRTDIIKSEINYSLGYIVSTYGSTSIRVGDGETGATISNPYMTQEILEEVFAKIGGFTFTTAEVDFYGDFRLEVGDIVSLQTDGVTYVLPVMTLEHNSDGGVVTTVGSVGETATQNSVDTNGKTLNELKRSVVNSETARSIAEQAADKISFVVEGDTASEFTVTENVIQATTEKLVIRTEKGGEVVIQNGIMYVDDIFAEEITATGTITGAKLYGATGEFEGDIASYGTMTLYSGAWEYNPDGTREFVKDAGALMLYAKGQFATSGATPDDMHLKIESNIDENHKTYIDLNEKNVLMLLPQNTNGNGGAEIHFGSSGSALSPYSKLTVKRKFVKATGVGIYENENISSPHIEKLMVDDLAVANVYAEELNVAGETTLLDIAVAVSTLYFGSNKNYYISPAGNATLNKILLATSSGIVTSDDAFRSFYVQNGLRMAQYAVDSLGNAGIYDGTNSKWILKSDTSGDITINGSVTLPDLKKDDDTHVVLAGSTGSLNVSTVTSTALYYIRNLSGDLQEQLDNRLTLSGGGKVNAPVSTQTLTPTANSTSTSTGHTLGTSSYKWRYLYAFSSSIQTSDRNYKHRFDYEDVQRLDSFFDALKPCSYFMIGGDRKHLGFVAQDVEEAMNQNGMTIDDLSLVCKDAEYTLKDEEKPDTEENREYTLDEEGNQKYIYGLKYTELHALEVEQIQRLKTRVSTLEDALEKALARIEALEEKINQ